jgi:hypothetical protein
MNDTTALSGVVMLVLSMMLLFLGLFGTRLLAWWLDRRHPQKPPCANCQDARCICHPGKCPFLP